MSDGQRCPHCGEPLISTEPGDTCSKCGATIVEKEAHQNPVIDDDHEMEIEDEKMVVPPERY